MSRHSTILTILNLFHRHNYFHFDPIHGDFDVVGLKYQWDDGIFSITLGNRQPDGYRKAYFHPMARFSVCLIHSRFHSTEIWTKYFQFVACLSLQCQLEYCRMNKMPQDPIMATTFKYFFWFSSWLDRRLTSIFCSSWGKGGHTLNRQCMHSTETPA